MSPIQTVFDVIRHQAEANPDKKAMIFREQVPLTYGKLLEHLQIVAATLKAQGIHRGDRIALVLPNGPVMGTAFLGTTLVATCAPLNPNYRADEFDFYLSDLNAKCLITLSELDTPARDIAQQKGIPILEISPQQEAIAGLFQFVNQPHSDIGPQANKSGVNQGINKSETNKSEVNHSKTEALKLRQADYAQAQDIALVLHTSGTTSRPKIVPLTHQNICTSVQTICQSLQLTEADRCLHTMPMFHIGGLIDLTLTPLAAGGTIIYTGDFSAKTFFQQLAAHHPTWYQAVPTILQELIDTAKSSPVQTSSNANAQNASSIENHSLRLIRSVAAALPTTVKTQITQLFQVPVIETYGMTEASPLITSTSLSPQAQKTGSVGQSVGPEIVILNDRGTTLPNGEVGEIAIRGENVITAYENNPTANAKTFTEGWFRTGDLGYLDSDGYLYLKGRSKEIINRGGQKISPAEVDAVLRQHPAIYQAVTFALPHRSLGEEVAVAIVLKANSDITPADITAFATERLAPYKVPRVIRLVDSIPKGPTGKLQRIGLAKALKLDRANLSPEAHQAEHQEVVLTATYPETHLAEQLVSICQQMLGLTGITIEDNFFAIGGNSLLAARFCLEVTQQLQQPLSTSTLLQTQSFQELAEAITKTKQLPASSLHIINEKGSKPPLFTINATGDFRRLLPWMDAEQPVYNLNFFGLRAILTADLEALTLTQIARRLIQDLQAVQPTGPYQLLAFCQDGPLALEIANQLQKQEETVALVCLIDSFFTPLKLSTKMRIDNLIQMGVPYLYRKIKSKSWGKAEKINRELKEFSLEERLQLLETAKEDQGLYQKYIQLFLEYEPQPYSGPIVLLLSQEWRLVDLSKLKQIAAGTLAVHEVKGMHNYLFDKPYIQHLAKALNNVLIA